MARPDAVGVPNTVAERKVLSGADNPLVRAVARMPWRVRTKLLLAFVLIVALFVIVGVLGLGALAHSNARVDRLGTLQLRASTYKTIQTQAQELRQLLSLRVAGDPNLTSYLGGKASAAAGGRSWIRVDQAIADALSQLGPSTDETLFGFVPPSADESVLARIRRDHLRFTQALTRITALDRAGTRGYNAHPFLTRAIDADNDLGLEAIDLASTTQAQTDALIAQNGSAYAGSRNLFIGVGAASVCLALLLGFVLSWSVIGPIQRTDERLSEIASGDFSKHVEVPNRDELGALAANLNRMNDELGRLYEELGNWNRTLEARVEEQTEELRASRARVVSAADGERRRIERDLHDGAQQQLIGLAVRVRLARDLADSASDRAKEILDALGNDLEEALDQLRELAHGIYPPLLQDRGLAEALSAAARRAAIEASIQANGTTRYAPDVESTVYFCCLEALQNAAKYAGREATASVTVREEEDKLLFEVSDDGAGFDSNASEPGAGFANMRDRVGAIGGSLQVESALGRGTIVAGVIPLRP
jgi:signal transduction histidine kinase